MRPEAMFVWYSTHSFSSMHVSERAMAFALGSIGKYPPLLHLVGKSNTAPLALLLEILETQEKTCFDLYIYMVTSHSRISELGSL